MDLNEIAVFLRVVQAGSFSKAGREMGMPNSTVSAKISALEERLGVTLIQRTTRKLSITDAGKAYYDKCRQGMEAIVEAESELTASQSEPQGLLRVTAPVELGSTLLPEIIARFSKSYPEVQLDVMLTDRQVDLLSEDVDLAVRAGVLRDSSLMARKLGDGFFALYASPAYLKNQGTPKHPKDLAAHRCIPFSTVLSHRNEWALLNGKNQFRVKVESSLKINDLNLIKALALSGQGVVLLPAFFCEAEVKAKRLVTVLPGWVSAKSPVHFVYPAQRFVKPSLKAFMEVAAPIIKRSLEM